MIKSELIQRISSQNPHLFARDIEKIVTAILDEIGNDKNARTREYRTKIDVLLIEPSYDLTDGWPVHFSRSWGNRERGSPALSQGATPFGEYSQGPQTSAT